MQGLEWEAYAIQIAKILSNINSAVVQNAMSHYCYKKTTCNCLLDLIIWYAVAGACQRTVSSKKTSLVIYELTY